MRTRIRVVSQLAGLLGATCLIAMTPSAAAQEFSASNISRYAGNGRWDWTVFISASPQLLNNIRCVEYTLHPSFPNPVRKVCSLGDRRYPFGLSSNGWGTFELSIRVIFKNGEVRFLRHMLTFESPPVERPLPITAGNDARQVRPGWWDWAVFIEAPEKVLDEVRCVEYTLHRTFPNPVRTICDRGEDPRRAFRLPASGWGMFQIGIRVFLKDGRVQELTHDLKF